MARNMADEGGCRNEFAQLLAEETTLCANEEETRGPTSGQLSRPPHSFDPGLKAQSTSSVSRSPWPASPAISRNRASTAFDRPWKMISLASATSAASSGPAMCRRTARTGRARCGTGCTHLVTPCWTFVGGQLGWLLKGTFEPRESMLGKGRCCV